MKFLVYIPCHSDFELALVQARKVRSEFENFLLNSNYAPLNLQLILSVNAYIPTSTERELAASLFDRVIDNGIGYLGDLNISNGFLVALDERPDLFWMLSTNDELVDGAINNILIEFIKNPSIDLLVTHLYNNEIEIEKQILDPVKPGTSYGLISGVVYRLERIFPYLHNGPFMAWTGWSQLAVIQSAMDSLNGINVKYIPFNLIYTQKERELHEMRSAYAHSIYGMLILGSTFKLSKKEAKKFIVLYVFKNFYRWSLYNRKWTYSGQLVESKNYLSWNQIIAEALIRKNSITTYYLYQIFKIIPFKRFYNVTFFIILKRKFDKILNQELHYK
jgi:hypothetical protein